MTKVNKLYICQKEILIFLLVLQCLGMGLICPRTGQPCPGIGPVFLLSLVAITPLLFEDLIGKYQILLVQYHG